MSPSVSLGTADSIQVRGARQHNLHNLNVDIPRDRLAVVTGLSGSDESSLTHDTIFAEGRRRYVERLFACVWQFSGVDQGVRAVRPASGRRTLAAVTIAQGTTGVNLRTTVASMVSCRPRFH